MAVPTKTYVEVERASGRLRALEDAHGSLRVQEDALSAIINPVLREHVALHCTSLDENPFIGCFEFGALGELGLSKVASTGYRYTRSIIGTRLTSSLTRLTARLVLVTRGSYTFVQRGRTCTLTAGDWTMIDANQSCTFVASPKAERFTIRLPRASDAAILALFENGVARRWNRTGLSLVLHAMVNESFGEMRRLPIVSERKLGEAITAMAWDALREQIEMPPAIGHRDKLSMRLKAYIERNLADPELSVERIARACDISVRGLHRLFADDPAGSVSSYLWQRRLAHCAEALRDPSQVNRSITDVCFSYGFSSSPHFSRLFKERFGVQPIHYRD